MKVHYISKSIDINIFIQSRIAALEAQLKIESETTTDDRKDIRFRERELKRVKHLLNFLILINIKTDKKKV